MVKKIPSVFKKSKDASQKIGGKRNNTRRRSRMSKKPRKSIRRTRR